MYSSKRARQRVSRDHLQQLILVRPHRIRRDLLLHIQRGLSVSVCLLVTSVNPGKTDEAIEMLFWWRGLVFLPPKKPRIGFETRIPFHEKGGKGILGVVLGILSNNALFPIEIKSSNKRRPVVVQIILTMLKMRFISIRPRSIMVYAKERRQ